MIFAASQCVHPAIGFQYVRHSCCWGLEDSGVGSYRMPLSFQYVRHLFYYYTDFEDSHGGSKVTIVIFAAVCCTAWVSNT